MAARASSYSYAQIFQKGRFDSARRPKRKRKKEMRNNGLYDDIPDAFQRAVRFECKVIERKTHKIQ